MSRRPAVFLLAIPFWLLGFSSAPAQASQPGIGFCQIGEAGQVVKRAGFQGQATGVRLVTNSAQVQAGEVVKARLVNFSAAAVLSGAEFQIQRYSREGWIADPNGPNGPWPRRGEKLKPGRASHCYRFSLPQDQTSGRYRFVTRVRFERGTMRRIAEFRVCSACQRVRPPRSAPCRGATEVDYEAPLAELPPLSSNTPRGDLDIGPPRLRLYPVGDSISVGGGAFGFELGVRRQAVHQTVRLNGYTELELDRVDRRGHAVETVIARKRALGVVAGPTFNGRPFLAKVPARPGLYSFQARLRDSQGASAGRYASYLRVVRPVTDVRLMTHRGPFPPKGLTWFWVENRGTREVDPLGREFALEVFEGGSWLKAPGNPHRFPKVKAKPLPAGKASGCTYFQIPPEAHPGLYRFSKDVILESGAKRQLTAEFEVSLEAPRATPRPRAASAASETTRAQQLPE
jgi:hypothetical protein